MEFLDVYLHEHKVGVLSSNNGRLEFRKSRGEKFFQKVKEFPNQKHAYQILENLEYSRNSQPLFRTITADAQF